MTRVVDAVAFDFGGVLIHALVPAIHAQAERHDIEPSAMVELLMGDPHRDGDHPWHRAERGELDVAEIQDELHPYAAEHGVTLHGDEIDTILGPKDFGLQTQVLDRVASLRAEGYQTALVTNSFREFRPTLEELLDLPKLFDVVVDSSQVGARKPSAELFEILLDRLDLPADRVLFLDDFAGNIAGARAVGLRTIHVTDVRAALAELDAVLAGT
jgi:epoxide hydrolase-like predicted phosphatase